MCPSVEWVEALLYRSSLDGKCVAVKISEVFATSGVSEFYEA